MNAHPDTLNENLPQKKTKNKDKNIFELDGNPDRNSTQ